MHHPTPLCWPTDPLNDGAKRAQQQMEQKIAKRAKTRCIALFAPFACFCKPSSFLCHPFFRHNLPARCLHLSPRMFNPYSMRFAHRVVVPTKPALGYIRDFPHPAWSNNTIFSLLTSKLARNPGVRRASADPRIRNTQRRRTSRQNDTKTPRNLIEASSIDGCRNKYWGMVKKGLAISVHMC